MEDASENDCCGNGCANCVLNVKPAKSCKADKNGKQNILEKYTHFYLLSKILHSPEVHNVWELHFKSKHSDNKNYFLDINVGYHLMMRRPLTEAEKESKVKNEMEKERKFLLRPYSPYWWDIIEMEFKILVNLIPNGQMSEFLSKLEINDEVEFRGPIGAFEYKADLKGEKYLVIISQGVAVAPVIPIVENILDNEDDMTSIAHIACYRDLNHVYFREKLYNFSKYWNYKVQIYLSQELCSNTDCLKNSHCLETCQYFKNKLKYKEAIRPNRLTHEDLEKIVTGLECKKENISIIIAGTGSFQNEFKELFHRVHYGFLENNIHLL